MQQGHAIATAADLPKLVGYHQLRELYGWPKRTVQDWIKARKFPKPLNLPGRDNYWLLDDIVTWVKGDLTRVAVTRPEDLKPEQLAEVAVDVLTRAIEHEIGQQIDPSGIHVTYAPPAKPVTVEAFAAAEAAELSQWQQRFADFDPARAYILAAILFPTLRPTFAAGARDDGVREVFNDDQALYDLALSAMNDDSWEHGLAALKARSKPKMNG